MSGPWEDYAPAKAEAGPWADYAPAAPKRPSAIKDSAKQFVTGAAESFAQAGDALMDAGPLGMLKRAAQATDLLRGKPPSPAAPPQGVNALSRDVQARATAPQTTPGKYMRTIGQMSPAGFSPKSLVARVANVVIPGLTSEAAGQTAEALGAGPNGQAASRMLGGVAGGVGASARFAPRPPPATADEVVGNLLAKRAQADPAAMRQQANALNASGVAPTLLDVTGQKGQRFVRAVGVTNDQAGEALVNNAKTVTATTKPAVMARTRSLSGESRTADQLAADLKTGRDAEARTTYGKFYDNTFVEVPDAVKEMLADSSGRSIIARARADAIENQDWGRQVELDKLLQPTKDGQLPQISAGTLDRLQIAARERGAKFAANGNGLRAKGAFQRQEQINTLLDDIPDLKPARAAYRAKSQALDILSKPGARKDPFSTDPTDYKAWIDSLPPEARHANEVAIRQEVLDTLGGQRSSTVGSIDELATSPYARENLGHALGEREAGHYLDNLTARLTQRGNAQFVSPNAGSRTAVLEHDTGKALGRAVEVADIAHKVGTGNVVGLAAKAAAWLKTRGVSDQQAQALAEASVDPKRLPGVIAAIERAKGPRAAREFITFRGGLVGAISDQRPRPQPRRP